MAEPQAVSVTGVTSCGATGGHHAFASRGVGVMTGGERRATLLGDWLWRSLPALCLLLALLFGLAAFMLRS